MRHIHQYLHQFTHFYHHSLHIFLQSQTQCLLLPFMNHLILIILFYMMVLFHPYLPPQILVSKFFNHDCFNLFMYLSSSNLGPILTTSNPPINIHSITTRGKHDIIKPKVLTMHLISLEFKNVLKVLKCSKWYKFMKKEYQLSSLRC